MKGPAKRSSWRRGIFLLPHVDVDRLATACPWRTFRLSSTARLEQVNAKCERSCRRQ
jgi:hypothetical protein